MICHWNNRLDSVVVGLLLVVLTGCGAQTKVAIRSSPDTFAVPPSAAELLRGKQSIAMNNAYQAPTPVYLLTLGKADYFVDLKQFTETVMTLLEREMAKKAVTVAPAAKSMTLRVHSVQNKHGFATTPASLVLDAEYGDGTKSLIHAQDSSAVSGGRAIDGALMRAVSQLLRDERFLAYANK
jgi:hypothetical protein